jgi:hypothetical protein
MARVGELSATQVAKAKGPVVLHDGGAFTCVYRRLAPDPGCSAISSTASAETWASAPTPIFPCRMPGGGPQSTATSDATA